MSKYQAVFLTTALWQASEGNEKFGLGSAKTIKAAGEYSRSRISAPGSSPLTHLRIPTAADCSQGFTCSVSLMAPFLKECRV